jgi:hypothetical protein
MIVLAIPVMTERKLPAGMHLTRRVALLYGTIAGILAAIGAVILLLGAVFAIPKKGSQAPVIDSSSINITADFVVFAISGLIIVCGLLATGSYWRAKTAAAHIAEDNARRQREEVAKTLKRLRERMSLPSLVELNRLMLSEYHTIATDQAQRSFRSSQRAMLGGFTWLIACFTAVIFAGSLDGRIIAATMAPVGSALAAFLGRTYIFVYERALAQLSQYYSQPLLNSYYLAAERMTSEMSPEARDRLIGSVVEQLLAAARNLSDGAVHPGAARRRSRVRVPGMRRVPAGDDDSKDHPVIAAPAGP